MKIEELKNLFEIEGYKIEISELSALVCVDVFLGDNYIKFGLMNELKKYLYSFVVFEDKISIFLNNEVLK